MYPVRRRAREVFPATTFLKDGEIVEVLDRLVFGDDHLHVLCPQACGHVEQRLALRLAFVPIADDVAGIGYAQKLIEFVENVLSVRCLAL